MLGPWQRYRGCVYVIVVRHYLAGWLALGHVVDVEPVVRLGPSLKFLVRANVVRLDGTGPAAPAARSAVWDWEARLSKRPHRRARAYRHR